MTQVLQLTDGTTTANFLTGNIQLKAEGWETKTGGKEPVWDVLELKSTAADSDLRTAQGQIDALLEAARQYMADPLQPTPVWLVWQSEGESAKHSLVMDGATELVTRSKVGPLLGAGGALLRVAIMHDPEWETTTATTLSHDNISADAGIWAVGGAVGTANQRIAKMVVSTDSGIGQLSDVWVGIRPLYKGTDDLVTNWDCELGSMGTDTSVTDGAAVCTFATDESMVQRLGLAWFQVGNITGAASHSVSPSPSRSASPSHSVSPSASPSVSPSVSPSASPSSSLSPSPSATPSVSVSPSTSPSASTSPSSSVSPSASPSSSVSPSTSASPSTAATPEDVSEADHIIGEYLVLLSCSVSSPTTECNIEMRHGWVGFSGMASPVGSNYINGQTAVKLLEMGVVQIPPTGNRDDTALADDRISDYAFEIYAERVAGSGSLYLDKIFLIPSKHSCSAHGAAVTDGPLEFHTAPNWEQYAVARGAARWGNVEYTFDNWEYPVGGGVLVIAAQEATKIVYGRDLDVSLTLYPRWATFRTS